MRRQESRARLVTATERVGYCRSRRSSQCMKNKILIPILLVLGASLFWFLGSGETGDSHVPGLEGGVVPTTAAPLEAVELPESVEPVDDPVREEVAPAAPPASLDPGEEVEELGFRADGTVLIEVSLDLPGGDRFARPHPLEGTEVHLQAWDEEADATKPYSQTAGEDGIARFHFPGAVHVDWFRAGFTPAFSHLSAFSDPHVDISEGSLFRIALESFVGGRVRGRVADLAGAGLAGVEVRAYGDNDFVTDAGDRLGAWYPAHYAVTTDSGGSFEFSSLPPGTFYFAVAPGDWLQVEPSLMEYVTDGCSREVEPNGLAEAGTLKVVPRETVRVRVTDQEGRPSAATQVVVEVVSFSSPGLISREEWEARFGSGKHEAEIERLRHKGSSFVAWPYELVELETDAQGQCSFVGVPGTWRVMVQPWYESDEGLHVREVVLPRKELLVRLPHEFEVVRGEVVDRATGAGIEHAQVRLHLPTGSYRVRSDARGGFIFPGAPVKQAYTLRLSHQDYFPESVELAADRTQSRQSMHPASEIRVQLVDGADDRLRSGVVQLLRRVGPLPGQGDDPAAAAWAAGLATPFREAQLSRVGTADFRHLYPGRYELALILPIRTGRQDFWGQEISEIGVWQTWTLETSEERTRVVADMGLHETGSILTYFEFRGLVRDGKTLQPLAGAQFLITSRETSRSLFSDPDGKLLVDVPKGSVRLEVSLAGYRTARMPVRTQQSKWWARTINLQPLGE